MGRIVDFTALAVVIISLYVLQFSGAVMLGELYPVLTDGTLASHDGPRILTDMREAVTVWVPTAGSIGAVVIVAYREYRRQQISSTQAVGGRPP